MVTMLLALIGAILFVLVPSCIFASKFFTLTEKAAENFLDFTEKIKEVNNLPLGSKRTFVLIMDQQTYVYPLNDQSRDFHVTRDPVGGTEVDFTLGSTPECLNQNCYCLCREYKDTTDRNCLDLICAPLSTVTFSQGTGQVLDRGNTGPRRMKVEIIKCEAGKPYCKLSQDGEISIIFQWLEQYHIYDSIK